MRAPFARSWTARSLIGPTDIGDRVSYGWHSLAWICALALGCAPPATHESSVPAPPEAKAEVSMLAIIPDQAGPSWAIVRADTQPGRLTVAGELRAPTACGHLNAAATVSAPTVLDLVLTRLLPGPDSVCLGISGTYRFIGVVVPLSRAPCELRAQYVYLRPDGSRQLDTLLADTTVRVP